MADNEDVGGAVPKDQRQGWGQVSGVKGMLTKSDLGAWPDRLLAVQQHRV